MQQRTAQTMLTTIIPWTVRGVIFYQGEADDHKARIYGKLLRTLIDNWRQAWRNPKLAFLFVQLAPYAPPASKVRNANMASGGIGALKNWPSNIFTALVT